MAESQSGADVMKRGNKKIFVNKSKFGCKALKEGKFKITRKDLNRWAKICIFIYRNNRELGIKTKFLRAV